MPNEKKINDFFRSFERAAALMQENCDILEKRTEELRLGSSSKAKHQDIDQSAKIALLLEDLGPITELINNNHVDDILINGHESVYVEVEGKLQKTEIKFQSEEAVRILAEKITAAIGRTLDPERPYVDARLPDGSRVNIIAPPLSLDGTSITIRKFSDTKYGLDNLVQLGCLSSDMAEFLKICAVSKINILVVGGTGTGKTTMLNAIAEYIPEGERIVTIEDSAELRIPILHKVRLETKPLVHGQPAYTEVTIRDLLVNALRMRPDRIIVGEVRGAEAYDMIQALNTGHEGSMTTAHANTGRDALLRLENMINMASVNMSSFSIKQRIASAIQLVLVLNRMEDGTRKVVNISEITGMESETIMMQTLFEFREKSRDETGKIIGEYIASGIMPRFAKRTFKYGFKPQMSKIFHIKM